MDLINQISLKESLDTGEPIKLLIFSYTTQKVLQDRADGLFSITAEQKFNLGINQDWDKDTITLVQIIKIELISYSQIRNSNHPRWVLTSHSYCAALWATWRDTTDPYAN